MIYTHDYIHQCASAHTLGRPEHEVGSRGDRFDPSAGLNVTSLTEGMRRRGRRETHSHQRRRDGTMLIELPDTRYVRTGAGEVAYQLYGDGPVNLVGVGGPAAHL